MSKKKSIEHAVVEKADKALKATKKKAEAKTAASAAAVVASSKPAALKKPAAKAAEASEVEPAVKAASGAKALKPAPTTKTAGDTAGKGRPKPKVNGPSIPQPGQITHEEIARLAYSYAEGRGFNGGSPEDDWARAEQELRSIRGI